MQWFGSGVILCVPKKFHVSSLCFLKKTVTENTRSVARKLITQRKTFVFTAGLENFLN